MAEDRGSSVLLRKAEAGTPLADPLAVTPARAFAQALERVAQDLLGLALTVSALREDRMTLAEMPELLEDRSLLAVLEGPGDALGLFALAPGAVCALIEVQTMGRLSAAAPVLRRPTRTDAAMSAGFIGGVLGALEAALAGQEALGWAGGYRYASFLDDPRPLGLLLEDVPYRVFRAELSLGEGVARPASLIWAVPAAGRRSVTVPPGAAPDASAASDPAQIAAQTLWNRQLEQSVMGAHVTLEAVLGRVTLPLSVIIDLQVGMEISLPMAAIEMLNLEGADRHVVCKGRLGQARGQRALRLDGVAAAETQDSAKEFAATDAKEVTAALGQKLTTTQPAFLTQPSPDKLRPAASAAVPGGDDGVSEPAAALRAGGI